MGALLIGAPIFLKSDDPAALAREHRRVGYSAAYCPAVRIGEKEKLRAIEAAFAKENVVIAEVGAWKNLLDVDPVKRKENFDYVVERMAIADEVGAAALTSQGATTRGRGLGRIPKISQKKVLMRRLRTAAGSSTP